MRFDASVVVRGGGEPPLPPRAAAAFVRALAARLRVPHEGATVAFVDDGAMREMNARFRGKDRSTDVLSFPSEEEGHLGDIAIATPTARRQARRRRHSAARETRLLLLHGFLHLLGYDHETDDGQMDLLEASLRQEMIT
jgi:probable rRNA maturation factor